MNHLIDRMDGKCLGYRGEIFPAIWVAMTDRSKWTG